MGYLIGLLTTLCVAVALLIASPAIHRWEKANDYPYGKMCDVLAASCKR